MSLAQALNSKVVTSVTLASSLCQGAATGSRRMRLRLGFEGRGDGTVRGVDRHGDAEVCALVLAVDDLNGAAMRRDELQDHRQADAGALDRRGLGGASSIESFEHVLAILRGDTGAVVGHIEHELGPGGPCLQ